MLKPSLGLLGTVRKLGLVSWRGAGGCETPGPCPTEPKGISEWLQILEESTWEKKNVGAMESLSDAPFSASRLHRLGAGADHHAEFASGSSRDGR